jgi:hypothetical protein
MSTYEKFYLVFAVILFTLNAALMVRNLLPGGKIWIIPINVVGALAIGYGFLNVLEGALA